MSKKNMYDVVFRLKEECDDCLVDVDNAEECVSAAILRGTFLKWSEDVDDIIVNTEDWTANHLFYNWSAWMETKVYNASKLLKGTGRDWDRYDRPTKDDFVGEIEFMLENNEEFKNNVKSKIEVEKQKSGESSVDDDSGDNDSGGGDEETNYTGKFAEVREVGILEDDNTVNKAKIKGAMLKFAKEVDAIEVDSMQPDEKGAREAFNTWMLDKFGNTWVLFIQNFLDPGEFREMSKAMFGRNEEYRSIVEDKWEYKPGNSKVDGGEEESEKNENGADGKLNSITHWANSESDNGGSVGGSDDSDAAVGNNGGSVPSDDDDVSGNAGTVKHTNERFKLSKFRKVKADKDEMFEVDDIRNTIIRENVWTALDKIPTNSVDCVVTSPPYWALRDYDDGEFAPIGGDLDCDHKFNGGKCYKCDAWRGQLGHEPKPEMFVYDIVAIFEKIGRILKPSGSVFLNIGDNYASENYRGDIRVKRKSMMGIPYRIYLKMMEMGWVMRNPIVWAKQIQMDDGDVVGAANPTSVKDRINHTFEPMWWFANSPDYYSDIFAVRREHNTDPADMKVDKSKFDSDEISEEDHNSITARFAREDYEPSLFHEAGGNIPDVWRIPTGKAGDEHPAVFSPRLPMKPIDMTCPKWVCDRCGTPYQREVVEGQSRGFVQDCSCNNSGRNKGIVFEPFCGRGTTCKAAQEKDRDWITTEVSDKYANFAEEYIDGAKEKTLAEFN
jgi:DNA modification methylase